MDKDHLTTTVPQLVDPHPVGVKLAEDLAEQRPQQGGLGKSTPEGSISSLCQLDGMDSGLEPLVQMGDDPLERVLHGGG